MRVGSEATGVPQACYDAHSGTPTTPTTPTAKETGMGHARARVEGATLVAAADDAGPITVGTPAWFTWLEDATTFTFTGPSGSFIARKERRTRGGWYWKAYRTVNGARQKAYLGKRENLTLERLERAAVTLATAATPA